MTKPKKRALIEHLKAREKSEAFEILIDPDLYFDGYDEPQCNVCANVSTPIPTSRFAARLKDLQQRPEVSAVFVRFFEYRDALEFDQCWIGSDSVYLVTNAPAETVRHWFADFEISDVWEESDLSRFPDIGELPQGCRLIAVWWD